MKFFLSSWNFVCYRIIHSKILLNFNNIWGFDRDSAWNGLECFKEMCEVTCTLFPNDLLNLLKYISELGIESCKLRKFEWAHFNMNQKYFSAFQSIFDLVAANQTRSPHPRSLDFDLRGSEKYRRLGNWRGSFVKKTVHTVVGNHVHFSAQSFIWQWRRC